MKKTKEFYTPYDISQKLGICYAKALEMIKYTDLPYTKIGRTYHVKVEDFNKFTAGVTQK